MSVLRGPFWVSVTVLSGDTWVLVAATAAALGWALGWRVLTGELGYCSVVSWTAVVVPDVTALVLLRFIEAVSKLSFCNIECRKAK